MPSQAVSRRVDDRLQELYERRLSEPTGAERYYRSGHGYCGPDEAVEEQGQFGICLVTADGGVFEAGDHSLPFALQSISKVLVYGLALADRGRERVLERVGVEPSGDSFNSLVFDEHHRRPYNPMVNAGALISTDMVRGRDAPERLERILDLMRRAAANSSLAVDEDVFEAELRTADRNRATAYLMRSEGMLAGDIEETLALYLRQCSVRVDCRDLAVMAATLANGCVNPVTGEAVLPRGCGRDVLSVMHMCGMYDAAGQWAFEVGVPAKSGVSGGIMAVIPQKLGIGIFSPGLDRYGNSVRGIRVCDEISERLGLHLFATDAEDALLGSVA